jgi:hypothetical protein
MRSDDRRIRATEPWVASCTVTNIKKELIGMENPYLTPPQVETPQSRSWGLGFAFGFQGPPQSSMAPADVQPEDLNTFDEGVLAGQDAAVKGLEISESCIDLNAASPTGSDLALEIPEGVMWIKDLTEGLAGGIAGGVLFALNLSIALETFTDDPEQRLTQAAAAVQAALQRMGFGQPLQLFIGGGVDTSIHGCELKLTSIYREQAAAEAAASGVGRSNWLVASWLTNQSGGATVVASSG